MPGNRFRATLAYDGTAYQGFQRQAGDTPTIQLMVEKAIKAVTQQQTTVIGAGRTDTGVHAIGQVITFEVEWAHDPEALLRAINAHLPEDIALQDIAPGTGFHPRFDAFSRRYMYTVLQSAQRQPLMRKRAWHIYKQLDLTAMQTAGAVLIGEHDFATFGQPPQGENTVRIVYRSEWRPQPQPYGDELIYTIEATAFLQHMVRRIVAMLVEVGRGTLSTTEFESRFRRADLSLAKTLAPPQGLILEAVRYQQQIENH